VLALPIGLERLGATDRTRTGPATSAGSRAIRWTLRSPGACPGNRTPSASVPGRHAAVTTKQAGVRSAGLEPASLVTQTSLSANWSTSTREPLAGLEPAPSVYETGALPGELQRHSCQARIRTSICEFRARCLAVRRPGMGTGGESRTPTRPGLSQSGMPVPVTPACAARDSNPVRRIKSPEHSHTCSRHAEPHRGVEPRSPAWRAGASPQCL
jgi:hypothetical protein